MFIRTFDNSSLSLKTWLLTLIPTNPLKYVYLKIKSGKGTFDENPIYHSRCRGKELFILGPGSLPLPPPMLASLGQMMDASVCFVDWGAQYNTNSAVKHLMAKINRRRSRQLVLLWAWAQHSSKRGAFQPWTFISLNLLRTQSYKVGVIKYRRLHILGLIYWCLTTHLYCHRGQ